MMYNLLRESEVAAMLGVTVGTMRQWRFRKQGPPFMKIGKMVRYDVDAVKAWIDDVVVSNLKDRVEAGKNRNRAPKKGKK